jgi:hypothetical protein
VRAGLIRATPDDVPRSSDRFAVFHALLDRVLRGPATAPSAVRAAAAGTEPIGQAELDALLDKVRHHAYRVTDDDIARVKAAGVDEETIFELTIAAALGVSVRRLAAAVAAIEAVDAKGSDRAAG